jgi:hypothetical protein
VGETRVDPQHLLEDPRDAYTGSLEETIPTEVIANALDSGATRVRLLTDAGAATLSIVDDGRGMQRRELARYHDIAASTKQRGQGIGFAGVGTSCSGGFEARNQPSHRHNSIDICGVIYLTRSQQQYVAITDAWNPSR